MVRIVLAMSCLVLGCGRLGFREHPPAGDGMMDDGGEPFDGNGSDDRSLLGDGSSGSDAASDATSDATSIEPYPVCFSDDFDDSDVSDWDAVAGRWRSVTGNGSPGLGTPMSTNTDTVRHPAMSGIGGEFVIEVDFSML